MEYLSFFGEEFHEYLARESEDSVISWRNVHSIFLEQLLLSINREADVKHENYPFLLPPTRPISHVTVPNHPVFPASQNRREWQVFFHINRIKWFTFNQPHEVLYPFPGRISRTHRYHFIHIVSAHAPQVSSSSDRAKKRFISFFP
jgi:hypothetical protein